MHSRGKRNTTLILQGGLHILLGSLNSVNTCL